MKQLQPSDINVITVPAFSDNYIWLFHKPGSSKAFVVDPGAAAPVEQALTEHNLTLEGVLVTHHHPDHVAGIPELLKNRDIPVYGPVETVSVVTNPMQHGAKVILDESIAFEVMAVPGHTLDHLAYYSEAHSMLFCGDTLFAAGCGRLFEGTPAQMHAALQLLADLPEDTLVYCAHEYTLANLAFSIAVEPDNAALVARADKARRCREAGVPTIPSTIGLEQATNPFLRVSESLVKAAAESKAQQTLNNQVDVFATLRQWKDNF